ncbi:DUF5304 family protein [Yinghuangia seranimata]|uniref:DUF5304 family protein n=1 Tax=Yinghuangia seranimata TaxID=408067 RepID=UPI00248B2CCB|nr:DUF5304 family protein [Yinghuangia seranimata]MDI2126123.1 DUF5304 family protein [Yinghuangia seranimata]
MKTTDGADDAWAAVADPLPGAREDADGPRGERGERAGAEPPPSDGPRPDPADRLAEEARKLAEALAGQAAVLRGRVVEPLVRKHPEAAAHLGAAGYELKAAYRAFVADKERRWASRAARAERVDLDDD